MRKYTSEFGFMPSLYLVILACCIYSTTSERESSNNDFDGVMKPVGTGNMRDPVSENKGSDYKYHKDYTIYYQEKRPSITVKLQNMKVLQEGQVIFICASVGNPVPRIKWMVNDKEILPKRYSIFNISSQKSVLRLTKAESKDNRSRITCQSTSLMGSAHSHASLTVYPSKQDLPVGFPNLASKSSVIVNEKNSRVVLDCNVKGDPKPSTIWFKDSNPVDMENTRLRLMDSGSLEINKTLEEDDAGYECMATNIHGSILSPLIRLMIREDIESTYRMIMRNVSYFAPHFISIPKDQVVRPGSSLALVCKAIGNPVPVVFWKCGQTILRSQSSNKTKDVGEATVTLSDLSESMRCTCVAKNTKESIEHSIRVSIHDFSSAPINIHLIDVSATSFTITWRNRPVKTDNYIYQVSVIRTDNFINGKNISIKVQSQKAGQSEKMIKSTVRDLSPFTNYTAWVEIKYPQEDYTKSNTVTFKTAELPPGSAPKNVELSAISNGAVAVIWEPPDEPNGVVTAYIIYYTQYPLTALALWNKYTLKIENPEVSKRLTSILSHLVNNVTYYISISAQNKAGTGIVSEAYPIVVRAGVVQGPKQLRAIPKSSSEIQLFWKPLVPRTQIHIISYRLVYHMKSHPADVSETLWKYSPEQNQKSIINLQSNTSYVMHLSAVTASGNGMVSTVEATTSDSVTEEPIIIHTKAMNSNQILVSWTLPKQLRNKVIYYRIQCRRIFPNNTASEKDSIDNYVKNGSAMLDTDGQFSYTFSSLKPDTAYQIYLNAITRVGGGTAFKSSLVSTWPEKIPKLQYLHLRLACGIHQPCVRLEWAPNPKRKQWIKGYRIRFNPLHEDERVLVKVTERNVSSQTLNYQTQASDHNQGYRYEFKVAPFSQYEMGNESAEQIFIMEGIPNKSPGDFQMKNSIQDDPTAVKFTWKRPSMEHLNGKLDHYEVKCYILTEEKETKTTYTTQTESIVVKNLRENKDYACSVRVWNGNVSGPWTNPIHFKTKDAYLLPPEKIRMIRLSHSTAHVTWAWKSEFPIYYSHFILYYTDEKSLPNRDDWIVKSTKSPFTKIALDSLNVTMTYVIRMTSVSRSNIEGSLSEIVRETKLGSESFPAKEVADVTCGRESSNNIQLRWKAKFNYQKLSHFRVNFTGITKFPVGKKFGLKLRPEEEQSLSVMEQHTSVTHEIRNLRPNTRYTVSIEPIFLPTSTSIGTSVLVLCTTLKEVPKSIPVLDLVDINQVNNQIHLLLHRPDAENGTIDIFYIIVSGDIVNINNITRQRRAAIDYYNLQQLLSKSTQNSDLADSGPYVSLSLVGDEIFPIDNSEKDTHTIILGTGRTLGTITDRYLNESIDYRIRVVGCIGDAGLQKYPKKCVSSAWSRQINIKTTNSPVIRPSQPNPQTNRGPSTLTMTTVVIILSIVILTVLLTSIIIILKRRNKLKSKLGIMYGTHATRFSKEKSLCMDNLLKEPLVDSAAGIATSESLRFNHSNNYLEITKMQLSPTPDLLVRSSVNQPLTSVVLFHSQSGRRLEPEPIYAEALAEHVAKLKENDCKPFSMEYESIEPGQQFTWNISNMEINRPKNRYANVIAYDHSRVCLQPLLKRKNSFSNETSVVPGSDYINANYIDGYMRPNCYIATQGPLAETIGDFWRMVWEQNSAVIVMMTRLEERERAKCDQYWPVGGKGSIGTYSNINVTILDTTELAYYTIRKFNIQKYGCQEGRDIHQLQFTAWPDHGVPNHPAPLLMFLRRVRAENPRMAGSMIVHCSAGVGRTGAFIVIDYMLEKLHYENMVDVCNYVTSIRAQRNYMVQTEEQYIFIHEALLEAIQCGNTEVSVMEIANHIDTLNQIEITHRTADGIQMTGLQMEYEKLLLCSQSFIQGTKINTNNQSVCSTPTTSLPSSIVTSQPLTFETAILPINQLKNRIMQMLPPDFSRVNLCHIRGVEGSDYINASWIDGYRTRKAYIAAQSPLVNTCEDFWRMLWENNSAIIVMLTRLRENNRERSYQYWPTHTSVRYQFFIIDPVAEYDMCAFLIREFKITDTRDSQTRVIRQFHYIDWRESEGIPESTSALLDVINQVHKTKAQLGLDGPITVHCSAGTGRTGIFIALSNVIDRMKNESVIDLFQTVKLLRWQRPALIQSEDQYQFCYTAALEYLKIYEQQQYE